MGILYAAVLAALMVTGAATGPRLAAESLGRSPVVDAGGFVTREWAWTAGGMARTFTASGPADQVDRLDPNDPTPQCPDCQLASSIRVLPEGAAGLTEVAD